MANLLNSKVAKVVTVSTAVAGISIAGVAYQSHKTDILEQINQLKKKADDWAVQAGDNKYLLQQQEEKYASVIAQLKDKLGLDLTDDATVDDIATALESYVEDVNSKTDVDTYNEAISSIATALGLELEDTDKDSNGMYDYTLVTTELANLDTAITDLEAALNDSDVIDTTGATVGDINGSVVDKINYLINQIQTANDDQVDILTVATEANESVESSSPDYIKLNYALVEGTDINDNTTNLLSVLNNSNLYGPVTTPIYVSVNGTTSIGIADATAYEYTTKGATEVTDDPSDHAYGIYKWNNNYYVVYQRTLTSGTNISDRIQILNQ